MKRSFLASLALLACAAVASVAFATYDRAVSIAVSAYAGLKSMALFVVATVAGTDGGAKGGMVVYVKAKAFALRIAKRDRPVVTASWRMCPSI
jgi:hypothetical protein